MDARIRVGGIIIMVRMENIKSKENTISMDCYMEGHRDQHFYLELDNQTFDIITNTLDEINSYVAHARRCIKRYVAEGKQLPERTTAMWY